MPSLAHLGLQRRHGVQVLSQGRTQRHCKPLFPRAQSHTGFEAAPVTQPYNAALSTTLQQPSGIYYGSNPPQSQHNGASLQPNHHPRPQLEPQYYHPQQQQSYLPCSPQGYQQLPEYPSAQQAGYPSPQGPASVGSASDGLARTNPGRNFINSVKLMGTISQPARQGRCTYAIIQVPYATKEGVQEFLVEAWDAEANHLIGLHGVQVVLDGRLGRDANSGGVKVVANRIQLVDQLLPATTSSYRSSKSGDGSRTPGEARSATVRLDPQQVWRLHYTTSTKTLKALAAHFGAQPSTAGKALLLYAFQSKSPLHWRVLAEEAGLGLTEHELQLSDFVGLVTQYKEEVAAIYQQAKPGATPPALPTTNDGMLKVKPIRDWALGKPEDDVSHYTVAQYESKHGLSMLYEVLRMGVVAEATQGVWNYDVEFGST